MSFHLPYQAINEPSLRFLSKVISDFCRRGSITISRDSEPFCHRKSMSSKSVPKTSRFSRRLKQMEEGSSALLPHSLAPPQSRFKRRFMVPSHAATRYIFSSYPPTIDSDCYLNQGVKALVAAGWVEKHGAGSQPMMGCRRLKAVTRLIISSPPSLHPSIRPSRRYWRGLSP